MKDGYVEKNSIMKVEKKIIPWKLGRREWHSKEWKKRKRGLKRELTRMKKGKINREEYVKKKKEYKAWCKEKKERYEKEEEKKIKSIKTEEEAWKYINKFRKKRERVDENIKLESWREHFMELLEGTRERRIIEEEGGYSEGRWRREYGREGRNNKRRGMGAFKEIGKRKNTRRK